MNPSLPPLHSSRTPATSAADQKSVLVTMYVGNQIFGIPALSVRDILRPQRIFPIPLAPTDIAGVINLRGHIVTVVDLRARLGMRKYRPEPGKLPYCITVDYKGGLYGLIVDQIGDVMELSWKVHAPIPATLAPHWRSFCSGVYRLDGRLLVELDTDQLFDLKAASRQNSVNTIAA